MSQNEIVWAEEEKWKIKIRVGLNFFHCKHTNFVNFFFHASHRKHRDTTLFIMPASAKEKKCEINLIY